jgi:hypothetical protein
MNPLPFPEILVLLFAILGYVPAVLDYRASRSSKIFFIGFTAMVLGIISQNVWLMTWNEAFYIQYHLIGILGGSLLFLYWTQCNYEGQQFMRKKIERLSREK